MTTRTVMAAGQPAMTMSAAASVPAAQAAAAAKVSAADGAIRFSIVIFLISLVLQRFALPMGELPLSPVGPIGLICGAYFVMRGTLVLDQRRVLALFVLAAVACIGTLLSITAATAKFAVISWASLSQQLLLSLFALLSFREPVNEERFFAAANGCMFFVGVAGILQFFAQFAGIYLFSFAELGVPIKYTQELFYNNLNLATGGVYKSNGFFLVEASVFSQFMALALAIELVYFRRARHLAVFALGLVLSISGTGWMVVAAFVAGAVARLGMRGLGIGVGALIVGLIALIVLAVALPEQYAYFIGRVTEISSPDTSAHQRFVTPFWALSDVMDETPWSLLVGAGAGVAERLHTQLSYVYGINTPLKIALEYGLPGLAAYLALFLVNERTPRQSALLLPAMVLFLFTGTYAQFAPILFPILLITSVARLRPTPPHGTG